MTFDDETWRYLRGEKFSNRIDVPLPYKEPIPNRVNFLTEMSRGKKVVHLGCLDHQPLIADKIGRGQWLHKELTDVASDCIGVDIDEEALRYVESKFGYNNIVLGNFTTDKFERIANNKWDYAILGELLEHIDNPVQFLSSIRTNYSGIIDRIVVTVPNAWTRITMRMAKSSVEMINSDHRYWFTPYTLAKVLYQAGMVTEEIKFSNRIPLDTIDLIKHKLTGMVGKKPALDFTYASSIIAIARI
ncbi:methyltransferase domain-containing protein [Chryseolinea sp. T2]|uniref:methyltransferase domain-containing protein n=1 Tax=Chryseolinea sp. T2 TaxID=3129255 RepID=UPI0030773DCD